MSGVLGPVATGRRATALAVVAGVTVAAVVDAVGSGLGDAGRVLALLAGLLVAFAVLVVYYTQAE